MEREAPCGGAREERDEGGRDKTEEQRGEGNIHTLTPPDVEREWVGKRGAG